MTDPGAPVWTPRAARGVRVSEIDALIGGGGDVWKRATSEVLQWKVKTRSGFLVDTDAPVQVGHVLRIRVRLFGAIIVEPVEVTEVTIEPDRVGFAYRTLPGHPVQGEEAFIVYRDRERVHLSVRSLTSASDRQPWRALFPLLLLAQRVVRRRYLRALRSPTA